MLWQPFLVPTCFSPLFNTPEPSEETEETDKKPTISDMIPAIVMEEFVFPGKLPDGLPPVRDAIKIETDTTADPPFRPVIRQLEGALRMCVDYRSLNKSPERTDTHCPVSMSCCDRFRKLDLISGYHQQRIFEPHTPKTAFHCRYG